MQKVEHEIADVEHPHNLWWTHTVTDMMAECEIRPLPFALKASIWKCSESLVRLYRCEWAREL